MCPNVCFWDASENQHCGSSESVLDDDLVHISVVSMTCRSLWLRGLHWGVRGVMWSNKPANRQTEGGGEPTKIAKTYYVNVSCGIHTRSCPPCQRLMNCLCTSIGQFDPRSRSGCITYIEQQRLSWSRSCHCFGQSKLETASKHWPWQFSWHVHITRKTERAARAAKHLSCCKLKWWKIDWHGKLLVL